MDALVFREMKLKRLLALAKAVSWGVQIAKALFGGREACAAACAAGERKRMKWGGRLNVVHLLKYVRTQAEGR